MTDSNDGQRRRITDLSEMRDLVREVHELSRRVTVLETTLDIKLQQVSRDLAELREDVAACATKEQLRPAVWLLGIIGSSGIGAFILTLWNVVLKRGGGP